MSINEYQQFTADWGGVVGKGDFVLDEKLGVQSPWLTWGQVRQQMQAYEPQGNLAHWRAYLPGQFQQQEYVAGTLLMNPYDAARVRAAEAEMAHRESRAMDERMLWGYSRSLGEVPPCLRVEKIEPPLYSIPDFPDLDPFPECCYPDQDGEVWS